MRINSKFHVLLALLLLGALFGPSSILAEEGNQKAPLQQFSATTLPRPENFSSLQGFITSNYTEYLVSGSMKTSFIGDFETVLFSTVVGGRVETSLLMDTGKALVLFSTARPYATDLWDDQPDSQSLGIESNTASCDTATNRCNCVLYARCLVPRLPYGLFTYADKKGVINSYIPTVGAVAVMNIAPPYGHVGRVSNVVKNSSGVVTSITLDEANYSSCKVTTTRSGSPSTLKVTGYFKP